MLTSYTIIQDERLFPPKFDHFNPWIPLIFHIQGSQNSLSIIVHKFNRQNDKLECKICFSLNYDSFVINSLEFYHEGNKYYEDNQIKNKKDTKM